MKIIVDTREQAGWTFADPRYAAAVEEGTLNVGDYSLPGLTDRVAVERKSLPDLVQCLGRERERFERELQRAAGLSAFCVVVEASWADLADGRYRSVMKPHAACQSVLAFACRYRVPFFFAGDHAAGEYVAWGFLRQYLETARKRLQAVLAAAGEEMPRAAVKRGSKAA